MYTLTLHLHFLARPVFLMLMALGMSGTTYSEVSGECLPVLAGTVRWWRLEGDVKDQLGGTSGTLSGTPRFTDGLSGQGLEFDGVDDQILLGASPDLNLGAQPGLTIECWVALDSISSGQPLVEWSSRTPGMHWWLCFGAPGNLFVSMPDTAGGSHSFQTSGGILTTNGFQHLALTYDRATGEGKLYRNGVEVQTASLGVFRPQTTYDLYLGARPGNVHPTGFPKL